MRGATEGIKDGSDVATSSAQLSFFGGKSCGVGWLMSGGSGVDKFWKVEAGSTKAGRVEGVRVEDDAIRGKGIGLDWVATSQVRNEVVGDEQKGSDWMAKSQVEGDRGSLKQASLWPFHVDHSL